MVVMKERERYEGLRERDMRDGYGGDERDRETPGFGSSQWIPQVLMCAYHVNKKKNGVYLC